MPVEIRTCDGRHYARTVVQNNERLPLIRLETPRERYRRRQRGICHVLILLAGVALTFLFQHLLKGL